MTKIITVYRLNFVQTTQKAKILPFKGGQGVTLIIVCLLTGLSHKSMPDNERSPAFDTELQSKEGKNEKLDFIRI